MTACEWRSGPCVDGTQAGRRCGEVVEPGTVRCARHTFATALEVAVATAAHEQDAHRRTRDPLCPLCQESARLFASAQRRAADPWGRPWIIEPVGRDECHNCGRRGVPEHVLNQSLGWCAACVMATRRTR